MKYRFKIPSIPKGYELVDPNEKIREGDFFLNGNGLTMERVTYMLDLLAGNQDCTNLSWPCIVRKIEESKKITLELEPIEIVFLEQLVGGSSDNSFKSACKTLNSIVRSTLTKKQITDLAKVAVSLYNKIRKLSCKIETEKVFPKSPLKINGNLVEKYGDGVKVGCTPVSKKEIIEAAKIAGLKVTE